MRSIILDPSNSATLLIACTKGNVEGRQSNLEELKINSTTWPEFCGVQYKSDSISSFFIFYKERQQGPMVYK